jgi:hypothetical protein
MPKPLLVALIVFSALIVLAAAWCGIGYAAFRYAGPVLTEERQVSGFTEVEVHGAGKLIITQGATTGLVVEARRRILEKLDTTVSGSTLKLEPKHAWYSPWTFWNDDDIVYRLTVTDLTKIDARGATDIQAQRALSVDHLDLAASGASEIELELNGRNVSVRVSGAAEVALSGAADVLEFASSGAAGLHSRGLQARVATVDCSGAADVEVNVSEQLSVDISGGGHVSYVGNPNVTSNISGAGDIERLQ